MKNRKVGIVIMIIFVLGCIVAFQGYKFMTRFDQSERRAIEIGRYFLDGVGRKTGRVLFIKLEEKKPNFYWDIALKPEIEWDRLDIWDRMFKYDRPEIREIKLCWIIRFEQAKRHGHFFEVWIDASENIVVGGTSCK